MALVINEEVKVWSISQKETIANRLQKKSPMP